MATTNTAQTKNAPKAAAQTAAAPAAESKTLRLQVVKKDLKFKGARQAWYERLIAADGKEQSAVLADLEAKRPSVYGSKSKHAGKPEPVSGWVRFFVRNGYVKFV
jgi:hypothetical protein